MAELHKTIWRAANELRGSMDCRNFRPYILGLLFNQLISEHLTDFLIAEHAAGNSYSDCLQLPVRQAALRRRNKVAEKGVQIRLSDLFVNVRTNAALDEILSESLERIFKNTDRSAMGQLVKITLRAFRRFKRQQQQTWLNRGQPQQESP